MQKSKEIHFIVLGTPIPYTRVTPMNRGGKRWAYKPKKTQDYGDWVESVADEYKSEELLDGALSIELHFYFARPKSRKNEKKYPYPDVKPDIDNCIKNLTDSLEGIIYTNDSRIVNLMTSKNYGLPERVEITIREIE